MNNLLNSLRNTESYKTIVSKLQSGERKIQLKGLYGSSKAYLLSALADDLPTTFLIVLPSQEEAEKFVQDLLTFLHRQDRCTPEEMASSVLEDVLLLPEWKVTDEKHAVSLDSGALPSKKIVADRMLCLDKLLQRQTLKDTQNIQKTPPTSFTIVVAPIKALMHKVLPKEIFQNSLLRLAVGDEIDLDGTLETLVHSGYRNVSMVEMKGEFARRGDILDIYPLTYDNPVRIELWGDEVDSIRLFDVASQRSIEKLNEVRILPVRELILTPEAIDNCRQKIGQLEMETTSPKFLQALLTVKEQLESQTDPDGLGAYLPWLYPNLDTLCDYLPEDTIVFVDEFHWISREADRFLESIQKDYEKKLDLEQVIVAPHESFKDCESIFELLGEKQIVYSALSRHLTDEKEIAAPIEMGMRSLPAHRGDFQMFWNEFREWQKEGYLVNILCDNAKQVDRMNYILEERRLDIGGISVGVGILSEGFISDELKLAMMSDDEIFGRQRQRQRRVKFKEGAPISSYMALKEGDYIVHVSHGIGTYMGIKHLDIDGRMQDFLMLQYAGSDVLYVPTYQIDMVQKYIGGGDDVKLKVDRLGGARWSQVKARVKQDVQKLAQELLELYAAREALPGHAFSRNTLWQSEFEASFPYEETPDQLKAIEETLMDMERPRAMDRLVCGDVGYGKTEVAMRAAFKAVMDGKQVAVLVPTTVLAQQHFITFYERFEPFPVKVGMLSRFRTPKEIKQLLEDLENGKVDIVIGTHRLLSKDVKFHDLGLLVIDEEHRFGVRHKERVKQLRKQVDVLTMSATPIPRTMHLSLVGARDLSFINTPPENRLPIETYVMEFKPEVVRDAILKEMDRGGQVYFVHNRIESIASVASIVQELAPQARISVAHGRMHERQLERIMLGFIAYKYDVLVCTTIIESGLDIPNVNTIIINRADALGLAQLYQLRGRVGRAQEQAYGYLLYPEARTITESAQKRLRVIEEFTDLSSGFKIALRDLEIRGVGNILGPEQHGHIVAVGYDMYCKLLNEAVKELKGEEVAEEVETKISLPIEAYLPDEYVPDSQQKVSLYKKIAALTTPQERSDLEEEMKDRYGAIPQPVYALLEIAELKQFAQKLGINAIISSDNVAKITFDQRKTTVNPRRLVSVIKRSKRLSLVPPVRLMVDVADLDEEEQLETVKRVLQQLA